MKCQYLTHNPEPGDVIVLEEAAYCDPGFFYGLDPPHTPYLSKPCLKVVVSIFSDVCI
jgi:hypothetical protein